MYKIISHIKLSGIIKISPWSALLFLSTGITAE